MKRNRRKKIECERLEISSRKSEIPSELFNKNGHNKEQKWYGLNRRYYEVVTIQRRTVRKKIFPIQVIMMVGSLT